MSYVIRIYLQEELTSFNHIDILRPNNAQSMNAYYKYAEYILLDAV